MNNKGFSLIELLGCLCLLTIVLLIGLYSAKDTLATTFSTLTGVSENEIYSATKMYVVEKQIDWISGDDEYTCVSVDNLVDYGYFEYDEVEKYRDSKIKVVRDNNSKVINSISIVEVCE